MKLSYITENEFNRYPTDEAESDRRFRKVIGRRLDSDKPHSLLRKLWDELEYRGMEYLFSSYLNNSAAELKRQIAKWKAERLAKQEQDEAAIQRSKDEPVPSPNLDVEKPVTDFGFGTGGGRRVVRSTRGLGG